MSVGNYQHLRRALQDPYNDTEMGEYRTSTTTAVLPYHLLEKIVAADQYSYQSVNTPVSGIDGLKVLLRWYCYTGQWEQLEVLGQDRYNYGGIESIDKPVRETTVSYHSGKEFQHLHGNNQSGTFKDSL
ncbi:hypothetical protein BJ742DRAFT_735885 [Cladochytrium replicatum]|nr:hypothetical protein BJ742DRAFT_735885 [Cladochytrium replicatum]